LRSRTIVMAAEPFGYALCTSPGSDRSSATASPGSTRRPSSSTRPVYGPALARFWSERSAFRPRWRGRGRDCGC